jgi:hypothetical protein
VRRRSRLLARSRLFEVEGVDPLVMTWATACAAVVANRAGIIPARRVAHVDPIAALRAEYRVSTFDPSGRIFTSAALPASHASFTLAGMLTVGIRPTPEQ